MTLGIVYSDTHRYRHPIFRLTGDRHPNPHGQEPTGDPDPPRR